MCERVYNEDYPQTSKARVNAPDLHLLNEEVLLLREDCSVSESNSATGASLVEVVLYPYAVFETHADADASFAVTYHKCLVFACPLIHLRLDTVPVREDKHLPPAALAGLDGLNEKSAELVALVFLE